MPINASVVQVKPLTRDFLLLLVLTNEMVLH